MEYISRLIFLSILVLGVGFFIKNIKKLLRNIRLGKDINRSDNKDVRWRNMAKIALGQYKMVVRPVSGLSLIHISEPTRPY